MVSFGPDIQPQDFTHMYQFTDLQSTKKPHLCVHQNTIYNYIRDNPNFSRFKKIIERARNMGQLNEVQADVTIMIPEDKYLEHLPQEFFDKMDDGLARHILWASCINRKIDKKLITSSPVAYYYTQNPEMRMYVTNINGRTQINNCMNIVKYDINLDNGIIHIVNGLIVPSDDHFMN